jgi:uncharacterized membrane protein HdeD (DUF308 family)
MANNTSTTSVTLDAFEFDPSTLGKGGINAVRAAFGLVGILSLALGITMLAWPQETLVVVAGIAGIYFIIAGIARLALGIFSRGLGAGHRVLGIVLGLIVLFAGIVIMRNLDVAGTVLPIVLALAIGIGWIVDGIMALVESGRNGRGGVGIAFGIFSIIAGIIVLAWPQMTILAIMILVGLTLSILGVIGIVRAFTFGKDAKTAD